MTGVVQTKANGSTASTSVTLSFSTAITAGDGVILSVIGYVPTITSSGGDSFIQAVSNEGYSVIFYVLASAGGYSNITIKNSSGVDGIYVYGYEVTKLQTVDDTSSNIKNSTYGTWNTNATAGRYANEIFIGIVQASIAQSGESDIVLNGPSSPWVNLSALGTSSIAILSSYQITTITGSQTYNGTTNYGNTYPYDYYGSCASFEFYAPPVTVYSAAGVLALKPL
jgi:hypothetical protein